MTSPDSTTARCAKAVLVVASENATSAAESSGRPESSAASRPACLRRPVSSLPLTSQGAVVSRRSVTGRGKSGGSSMITCALVPLMPNAETAARRGRSRRGHGRARSSSRTAPADQSTCGEGRSACSDLGSSPCRIASIILITPAIPAAAWV